MPYYAQRMTVMKKVAIAASVFLSVSAAQAEQSIDDLVAASKVIATKIKLGTHAATGAVDYMYEGKVIPDYTSSEDQYLISEAEVQAYNQAIVGVRSAMYFTSSMALEAKAEESIAAVKVAVDSFVVATTQLKEVEEVAVKAEAAKDSGSVADQTAVQEYVETNNVSITQEVVDDFNQSLTDIAVNAREAGAFLAASKDVQITETADRHAKEFNVSFENAQVTYSATNDILQFTWQQAINANHSFHGFMTTVTADQVLSNGETLYAEQGWIMR
jgi:hypothetical protein